MISLVFYIHFTNGRSKTERGGGGGGGGVFLKKKERKLFQSQAICGNFSDARVCYFNDFVSFFSWLKIPSSHFWQEEMTPITFIFLHEKPAIISTKFRVF